MIRNTLLALTLSFVSTASFAGPNCTTEPRSAWMPADKVLAQATQEVPKLKLFKVTKGNCFEIYGWGKDGEKLEIYYHPVTGEIVKRGNW